MIRIVLSVLVVGAMSCAKSKCDTCIMYVVGPDPQNLPSVKRDTIYANAKYCGDDLKTQKAENGKYREMQIGGNRYRWTTIVQCK